MRSTMIKSALIAAMLAAGAFTATSASAFSHFGGGKGGLGNHGGQHSGVHPHGHFGWGSNRLRVKPIPVGCINVGYVDADGNPVVTKPCRRRFGL